MALSLYREIEELPPDERNWLQERLLSTLSPENATLKRTYKNRFGTFDDQVLATLEEEKPPPGPYEIHDMAVSDGRTAVEFYRRLSSLYDDRLDFHCSDYAHSLIVVSRPRESLEIVIDDSGKLVQIVFPPFVFNTARRAKIRYFPVNRLVEWAVTRFRVRSLLREFETDRRGLEV
ncbi:MAG: hypothetical protein R3234_07890, partial [Thermoanaerobaculia bacterium]|nr:hypothetical protein [Thermoanaerobaculia bacterium]